MRISDIWRFLETRSWVKNPSNDNKVTRLINRGKDWVLIKMVGYNKYVIINSELTRDDYSD